MFFVVSFLELEADVLQSVIIVKYFHSVRQSKKFFRPQLHVLFVLTCFLLAIHSKVRKEFLIFKQTLASVVEILLAGESRSLTMVSGKSIDTPLTHD